MAEDGQPEQYVAQDGVLRLRNTEIVLPLITGSIAQPKPKQKGGVREGAPTHSWTFYVRSLTGHDLSHIISQMVVELHASFANPTRTFLQGPFEVVEEGWGEFEILVKISFIPEAMCEPVELVHRLRLFAEVDGDGPIVVRNKQVISEQYEEIIFFEPPVDFHGKVTSHVPQPAAPFTQVDPANFLTFNEEQELRKLSAARQKLASVCESLQQRLSDWQSTPGAV